MELVDTPTMPVRRNPLASGALLALLAVVVPASGSELEVVIVDRDGTRVGNAVVAVSVKSPVPKVTGNPEVVRIEQSRQQFAPRVTVIRRGTSVQFPNRDITQHHVYSFSPAKTFEIELYRGDTPDPIAFNETGIVALGCNIHDWMLGFIYVTDHERFAVTDDTGSLSLELGANEVRSLHVWHPAMESGTPVTLKPTEYERHGMRMSLTVELDVSLKEYDPLNFEIDPLQALFRDEMQ